MKLAYTWSSFVVIVFLNILSIEGNKIFSVIDYGANPNDNLDDSAAIQTAINAAIRYGLPSIADFPAGNYTVASTITIVNATNLTVKGVGSDQTFLIGTNPVSIFFAQRCQGLKFTLFSIDYDPLPFTAGYVVNVDDKYIDVQIVPPHQTNINQKVQAILRYDPERMRPAFGSNTYEIYQTPPADVNTSLVSPGVLRLPLANPAKFAKNDPIVARYAFTQHSMYAIDLTDITVQSIVIHASWGMGFPILRARRLNINDYHVKRPNDRWMSTSVDCMHFTDAREYISLTDSSCEAMGDDGLNVHGVLFEITQVIDSNTIIMQTASWTDPLDVGVGTHLEFTSNQQPFTVHGNGTVASLVFNTVNSRKVSFTGPVTVNVGDWACVSDTPYVFIRNFTVSHNRARGVLLESRNIDIQQSIFNRTSGPAVLIQPSLYWKEAPEARNVSLSKNLYLHNNEGIAQGGGIITILPDPPQLVPVINDIRIEQSTFDFGQYSQGLLQTDNGNNVFIRGNYIAVNSSAPLVLICNSRNISADNNCVVTNGAKIDQYYTFDTTGPCSMNLSSLIDLPPSAFNSSFPPPVVV